MYTMNSLNKLYSYLLLSLTSILFVNAHPTIIKQDIDWPQIYESTRYDMGKSCLNIGMIQPF